MQQAHLEEETSGKVFRNNFMQPNTTSKINTAAEFLENGIFSSQTVQHSPCFAQFSENWAMLSVSVAAGTPLLFKIHYSPWFTFEKKSSQLKTIYKPFCLTLLICSARPEAQHLNGYFCSKLYLLWNYCKLLNHVNRGKSQKNVSLDLKFTSALVTRTKKIKAGLSL